MVKCAMMLVPHDGLAGAVNGFSKSAVPKLYLKRLIMSGMFDPDTFVNMIVDQPNSTSSTPCPADEFVAVVKEVKARQWKKKDDPSVAGMALDILWSVDDAAVRALLDREEVVVKQGVMLDLTEQGGLDMGKGKNVGLGRLREALSLNEPGQPFSFSMMAGRPAKIVVSHRPDNNDTSIVYAEVKAVAKL